MKLRTAALALALVFGVSATVEARPKPASQSRKAKKGKRVKPRKIKPRKVNRNL